MTHTHVNLDNCVIKWNRVDAPWDDFENLRLLRDGRGDACGINIHSSAKTRKIVFSTLSVSNLSRSCRIRNIHFIDLESLYSASWISTSVEKILWHDLVCYGVVWWSQGHFFEDGRIGCTSVSNLASNLEILCYFINHSSSSCCCLKLEYNFWMGRASFNSSLIQWKFVSLTINC